MPCKITYEIILQNRFETLRFLVLLILGKAVNVQHKVALSPLRINYAGDQILMKRRFQYALQLNWYPPHKDIAASSFGVVSL